LYVYYFNKWIGVKLCSSGKGVSDLIFNNNSVLRKDTDIAVTKFKVSGLETDKAVKTLVSLFGSQRKTHTF